MIANALDGKVNCPVSVQNFYEPQNTLCGPHTTFYEPQDPFHDEKNLFHGPCRLPTDIVLFNFGLHAK